MTTRRCVSSFGVAACLMLTFAGSTTAKGDEPAGIVASSGAAWISTGKGQMTRILVDGRITARIPLKNPYASAPVAYRGAVWVTDHGWIYRIAASAKPTMTSYLYPGVSSIAVANRQVWVVEMDRSRILSIDPASGARLAAIHVKGTPLLLYGNGSTTWIMTQPGPVQGTRGRRVLIRIDDVHNRLSSARINLACNAAVALGVTTIWIADPCSNTIRGFNARSGRPIGQSIRVQAPVRLAVTASSLWIATQRGLNFQLVRIDRETRAIKGTTQIRTYPVAVATDGKLVWVVGIDGTVARVSARTGHRLGRDLKI